VSHGLKPGPMNDRKPEPVLPRTSRAIEILTGIFFLPVLLVMIIAAVGSLSSALSGGSPATIGVLLLGFWGISYLATTNWRLFPGRGRRDGGLVSPLILRIWGALVIVFPAWALLSGSWRDMDAFGKVHLAMALLDLGVAVTLFRLASVRSAKLAAWRPSSPRSGQKASTSLESARNKYEGPSAKTPDEIQHDWRNGGTIERHKSLIGLQTLVYKDPFGRVWKIERKWW
jgi:hypothetical protein